MSKSSAGNTPPSRAGLLPILGGIAIALLVLAATTKQGGLSPSASLQDWVGKPAPELDVVDLNGSRHRLSEMRGKRVFLVFWGTNCVPCIHEIPTLKALREEVPESSMVLLGLTGDDKDFLIKKQVVEKLGINYPIISYTGQLDRIVTPYRNVNMIPTLMVIGPEGRIDSIAVGGKPKEELLALARG
ncbi:MAG: redoxin domain-containing protein [Candidatus Omnitrophica bacterium]|nr:Thiol-disulfide oxidoreductase ResA [bacterium]NUN98949.1 redoxin domain-containing protein [Candidatus Omnitrophota bacterium]